MLFAENKEAITMSSKNVDRLSMLPEDILSQILSRMPTIFVVRTSILSKRWRYSWMLVTNIDVDDNLHPIGSLNSFIKFVDRVLELCKTSHVNLFRVRLPKSLLRESMVSNWIEKAVKLNVHELDLQVRRLQLPVSLFTCKSLTKLRLECSRLYDYDLCECRVNLPCLITLDLVGLKNSFVNISKLISGCPLLEDLSFEVRWRPYDVRWRLRREKEDHIFNIPTLKRLNITWESSASQINKVVLNVPNLEYLFVGGVLTSFIIMEDASSLVEACVSFTDIRRIDHHHPWVELLKGLSGAKSLSVQQNASTSLLPNFTNMTHLELKSCWNSIQVLQFLENSSELEHLYIEKLELEYSGWIKPKRVPSCMLTKLTTINLSNCEGKKWEIEFLEYMLGSAKGLKTLTITWGNVWIVDKMRLCEQLLAVPKASQYCQILFLGCGTPSTLVKRASRCGGSSFETINHDVY